MKNIITLVLVGLPLLATTPAAMSGCASTRTLGEQSDDTLIKMRVGQRLSADPEVKRFNIDVDVMNAVVTLRGEVEDQAVSDEAEKLARNTEGVTRVENKLMIASEDKDEPRGDLGIQAAVGTRLLADPDVRRHNIDVDVVNGVVYLSGVVHDQPAKDTAERIASRVDGVTRVENELQVSAADEALSDDVNNVNMKSDKGEHNK
ncbi:Osmotically-inducible protein Y precursor [Enhygromyxa salina]|uniref:Osmotically-inducible protein Y n=1 Tax=Enhygromyxa salina TaxID=215803 RepID=A0A2S9XMS3_9BACT|nr:BON domain-containing protein [Enhygromyxa salina]PRP94157.1 Osmotically-inducible protein Y precursor [Enhygromyxa salina]